MVPELSGNFLSFLVVQRSFTTRAGRWCKTQVGENILRLKSDRSVGCETQSVTSLDSRCVGDGAVQDGEPFQNVIHNMNPV